MVISGHNYSLYKDSYHTRRQVVLSEEQKVHMNKFTPSKLTSWGKELEQVINET